MKKQLIIAFGLSALVQPTHAQMLTKSLDTIQVVLDNDELKVTSYLGTPGKDVCGLGKHTNEPHLTIFLTDASVTLLTPDGKEQDFQIKSGATLWSERDTHVVVNNGRNTTKVYLVEMKKK